MMGGTLTIGRRMWPARTAASVGVARFDDMPTLSNVKILISPLV
jgi:hypothetical protein